MKDLPHSLVLAIHCILLACCLVGSVKLPALQYAGIGSGVDLDTRFNEIKTRMSNGFGKLMPNYVLSNKIKARKKKGSQISFTEHQLLTIAKDDFWKIFRMVLTVGYSREFFLYSYALGPLISNNAKAWSSWPSSFELPKDRLLKYKSLNEKRVVAIGKLLGETTLQANVENEEKVREKGERNIEIVNKALRCKDPSTCLEAMHDYIFTEKKHLSKVFLKGCNGAMVKSILTALGGEGLPNIPLINRLNCNEIANALDKIGKSDQVLNTLDLQQISDREVMAACRERGILPDTVASGRADLSRWLSVIKEPMTASPYDPLAERTSAEDMHLENIQNKRLVLMGYYMARNFKKSDTSILYRAASGAI